MDEKHMKQAIEIAKTSTYEVPVGAVVVYNDMIIGRGYNKREGLKDPTAHAEMEAIRQASKYLGGWRLMDCTLYTTLEPCAMCAGAIINARLARVVVGAMDPRYGFCGSVEDIVRHPRLNHRVELKTGVLEKECAQLLKDFFMEIRKQK